MTSIQEQYLELVALCQLYLMQDLTVPLAKAPSPIKPVMEQPKPIPVKNPAIPQPQAPSPIPIESKPVQLPSLKPALEEKEVLAVLNLNDMKKLILSVFPSLPLIETVPSDAEAKKINNKWKESASILIVWSGTNPLEHVFVKNLASAIHMRFSGMNITLNSSKEIAEGQFERFQFILAPTSLSLNVKDQDRKKLCQIANIDDYIRNPQLKAQLWNTITRLLRS